MSERENNEYIEISVTKMVLALINNIKTFVVVVILGLIGVGVVIMLYKPTYQYSMYIQPANYTNYDAKGGNHTAPIITDNQTMLVVNSVISRKIDEGKLPKSTEIRVDTSSVSKDINNLKLSFALKQQNSSIATDVYDALNEGYKKSNVYLSALGDLRSSINNQIKINEENIAKYNSLIENDHKYLKELSSQKGLEGMAAQILLASSYLDRIDNYQQHIYNLENSQKYFQLEISSIKEGLSTIGDYSVTKSNKTAIILFAGIILSLVLGCVAVATRSFIVKLKDQ